MTSPFAKEATKSIARWVVAAWLFVQLHVLQYKLKAFLSNELGQKHFLILAQEQPDKKDYLRVMRSDLEKRDYLRVMRKRNQESREDGPWLAYVSNF